LRRSENRVLREICGPKTEEVARGWRRLHNEKLHNLYAPPNVREMRSKKMNWAGYVAHMREMRNAYKILVRKPEGKRPCRRPRHRLENNIRMDLTGGKV
jgi:hypothetical protein